MVLHASANALTYPDAAHSAVTMPTTNMTPAVPRCAVIELIGPWNVFAALSGPSCETVSVSTLVTRAGSANRPTSDTSTSTAGNSDSTA